MSQENLIYPSAFTPCVLRCFSDSGHSTCTLYMEHTCDTMYVQLAFTKNVFKNGESIFRCEYMEAKDGGLPFLIIVDCLQIRGNSDIPRTACYNVRLEFIRLFLEDLKYFDISSMSNEFRVRFPTFFSINEIQDVFSYIIPNFYGVVHGVSFTNDSSSSLNNFLKIEKNQFLIRKTRYSDVYELFLDGVEKVPGNNIAYIPTITLSKKVSKFLENKNSAKINCEFCETRQKWIPML